MEKLFYRLIGGSGTKTIIAPLLGFEMIESPYKFEAIN